VGMDTGRGLVHSLKVTNAAVHDYQIMDVPHGEGRGEFD
jgi:hypothetical protein